MQLRVRRLWTLQTVFIIWIGIAGLNFEVDANNDTLTDNTPDDLTTAETTTIASTTNTMMDCPSKDCICLLHEIISFLQNLEGYTCYVLLGLMVSTALLHLVFVCQGVAYIYRLCCYSWCCGTRCISEDIENTGNSGRFNIAKHQRGFSNLDNTINLGQNSKRSVYLPMGNNQVKVGDAGAGRDHGRTIPSLAISAPRESGFEFYTVPSTACNTPDNQKEASHLFMEKINSKIQTILSEREGADDEETLTPLSSTEELLYWLMDNEQKASNTRDASCHIPSRKSSNGNAVQTDTSHRQSMETLDSQSSHQCRQDIEIKLDKALQQTFPVLLDSLVPEPNVLEAAEVPTDQQQGTLTNQLKVKRTVSYGNQIKHTASGDLQQPPRRYSSYEIGEAAWTKREREKEDMCKNLQPKWWLETSV